MTNPYGTPAPAPYPQPPMPPRRKRPVWPWFLGGGVALFLVLMFVVFLAVVPRVPPGTGASNAGDSASAAPAESSEPAGQLTESGFRKLAVGEEASFGPNNGADPIVRFTITKITVDPKCGAYMRRPADKHTLLVDITAQTLDLPDPSSGVQIAATLNPLAFQTRGADGTTHAGSIGTCVGTTKPMPMTYAPNSKYAGQVEILADDKAGALLLSRNFTNGSGWEWPY
ncbi:hypothetical protein [Amycolatopsis solani]|uniref:hypothetical protein n=1 Tax=Amycolatopsis solani TaxID=3028615 RepID=UPI0025B2608E|nr:hypothetical protein [Amycolatopsis sp. MEP2-6]